MAHSPVRLASGVHGYGRVGIDVGPALASYSAARVHSVRVHSVRVHSLEEKRSRYGNAPAPGPSRVGVRSSQRLEHDSLLAVDQLDDPSPGGRRRIKLRAGGLV